MREDTRKFIEWRKQRQLLIEELEVTVSQKLNLLSLSEDDTDCVTDHSYDDLFKLK